MAKRRNFSAAFKAKVALEALAGRPDISAAPCRHPLSLGPRKPSTPPNHFVAYTTRRSSRTI